MIVWIKPPSLTTKIDDFIGGHENATKATFTLDGLLYWSERHP